MYNPIVGMCRARVINATNILTNEKSLEIL